jgi:drug/metabolite transporter (DMT)-like permease
MTAGPAPWWCWPILAASVLSVSSAAVVFAEMPAVPAMTLAAWRLQLTAVLLAFGFAWQWRAADARARAAAVASWRLLAASGAWLALHFALWVASLKLTSLPHSVLIISLSPVLLVLHARVTGGPEAVAAGEAWGVALAAAGAAVLSAGAAAAAGGKGAASAAAAQQTEVPASLLGDAAALAACAAVLGYLLIGRRLRSGSGDPTAPPPLPLCLYAAPVTAAAAALLTAAGFLFEKPPTRAEGVFGWLLPSATAAAGAGAAGGLAVYGPKVAYLAFFPGIVGHTGFNFLLAHVAPLAVSLALDLECVVAPVMARVAGVTKAPLPATTWVGGAMMVAAAVAVTVAGAAREARAAAAGAAAGAGAGAGAAAAGGGLKAGGEEVAMTRLPTHDEGEEEEEGEEEAGGAPVPRSLAHDDNDDGDDEEALGAPAAALMAPRWAGAGAHRHRQ